MTRPAGGHFLARLDGQLASLKALVEDAGSDKALARSVPGQWSATDNLAHLVRYHEIFLDRLQHMEGSDNPEFGRYRAEEDPGFDAWLEQPAAALLGQLESLRARLRTRLSELEAAGWQRTGVHPVFGAMTVAGWVDFFLIHEAHHLYVIRLRLHGV